MKTYFAKYIPVEGEIKEGDKYITNCGNIYTSNTSDHSEIIKATNKEAFNKYFKKVKLFLCSRDVQVGDRIKSISNHPNEITGIVDWIDDYINYHDEETKEDYACKSSDAFKVIGEISPDAIWVKEGDEFDESQWGKPFPKESIIVIKCSQCNTFH